MLQKIFTNILKFLKFHVKKLSHKFMLKLSLKFILIFIGKTYYLVCVRELLRVRDFFIKTAKSYNDIIGTYLGIQN